MTKFIEIPGQESWDGWPSSNRGWRLAVWVGSALLLLAFPLCLIGLML